MGNNYDIILIGLVAVFLILRLRSVLGKRTGNERPPARDPFTPPAPPTASNCPSALQAGDWFPTCVRQSEITWPVSTSRITTRGARPSRLATARC